MDQSLSRIYEENVMPEDIRFCELKLLRRLSGFWKL